jgi:hypothetical protein
MTSLRLRLLAAYRRARTRVRDVVDAPAFANVADPIRPTGLPGDPAVIVHFADPPAALYQLAGWLPVLERLHASTPVMVICRDPETFGKVAAATTLPVGFVSSFPTLVERVTASSAAVCLHLNHHLQEYQSLRIGDLVHVHVGHGESDKDYMASNQLKAYDYVFVAGQAAVDRLAARVRGLDPDRVVMIGRPQVPPSVPAAPGAERTVLYAPTFEGDGAGARYTSLDTMGTAIASALLTAGWRVIYRPHPMTGVNDPRMAAADRAVRALVGAAGVDGRIDTDTPFGDLVSRAGVLVADVSAVVVDWLPSGRPFFVTHPAGIPVPGGALDAGYPLAPGEIDTLPAAIERVLADDPLAADRGRWARHHLGTLDAEQAFERFAIAIGVALAESAARRSGPGEAGERPH